MNQAGGIIAQFWNTALTIRQAFFIKMKVKKNLVELFDLN